MKPRKVRQNTWYRYIFPHLLAIHKNFLHKTEGTLNFFHLKIKSQQNHSIFKFRVPLEKNGLALSTMWNAYTRRWRSGTIVLKKPIKLNIIHLDPKTSVCTSMYNVRRHFRTNNQLCIFHGFYFNFNTTKRKILTTFIVFFKSYIKIFFTKSQ